MENKQTAVQWLSEEIFKPENLNKIRLGGKKDLIDLIERAIEIEKSQIVTAANIPKKERWFNAKLYRNCGEQYYEKTYKNK